MNANFRLSSIISNVSIVGLKEIKDCYQHLVTWKQNLHTKINLRKNTPRILNGTIPLEAIFLNTQGN